MHTFQFVVWDTREAHDKLQELMRLWPGMEPKDVSATHHPAGMLLEGRLVPNPEE